MALLAKSISYEQVQNVNTKKKDFQPDRYKTDLSLFLEWSRDVQPKLQISSAQMIFILA